MKRTSVSALVVAAIFAVAGCSRNNGAPADSALNTDLSLAAQQKAYQPLDTRSAAEGNTALTNPPVSSPARRTSTATRRTSTASRTTSSGTRSSSSGSSTGTSSGSVGTAAPTSSGHVVKNTKRDAAIGAAAGAIIGAAVGGILGGVIGNNVDKKKVP
jgi:hypothetical protein